MPDLSEHKSWPKHASLHACMLYACMHRPISQPNQVSSERSKYLWNQDNMSDLSEHIIHPKHTLDDMTHDKHDTWCDMIHDTTWQNMTCHMACDKWHMTWHDIIQEKTWHMTHYDSWHMTQHDSWHNMMQDMTWYMTQHDKWYDMTHLMTWHKMKHDTTWHITCHDTWHKKTHDMIWHIPWHDTWHDMTHDMTHYTTWCTTWHDT